MIISPKLMILCLVFLGASFILAEPSRRLNPTRPKAFDYAADAEQVVGQLHHNFSCDGREYGYYADQGQQCKVFHICMPVKTVTGRILDTFQFSFFCPSKTRFSQDSRTCISEDQAYPCDKAHTLYDLNKAIGHKPKRRKRPLSAKEAAQGTFRSSVQEAFSNSPSLGNEDVAPFLKKSFENDPVSAGNIDESLGGFSVQEGVTPVHTDSTLTIGAPAVAIPASAENAGSITNFAGRPRSSTASRDHSVAGKIPSNDLSEDLDAPDFVIPPGSQIIATKSLQHQNALSEPNQNRGSNTKSSINISTHGSSGLSNSFTQTQSTVTTSSTPTTFGRVSSTSPLNSIESTTPHSGFTTSEDFGFSKIPGASQGTVDNSRLNSVIVNNRGNSFTSTESPVVFSPIPQRNRQPSTFVTSERPSASADNVGFSNSHTLEAALVNNRGTVSTFASRTRANSVQSISQQRNAQISQSGGQRSQSSTFSQNVRLTTPRPNIATQNPLISTQRPFTATQSSIPSLSQQFTPPPTTPFTSGASRPLKIPGFSAGVSHNSGVAQPVSAVTSNTQRSFTEWTAPTTTEYFLDEEFETTFTTEIPFESTKSINQNSNFASSNSQINRGPSVQEQVNKPVQGTSNNQFSRNQQGFTSSTGTSGRVTSRTFVQGSSVNQLSRSQSSVSGTSGQNLGSSSLRNVNLNQQSLDIGHGNNNDKTSGNNQQTDIKRINSVQNNIGNNNQVSSGFTQNPRQSSTHFQSPTPPSFGHSTVPLRTQVTTARPQSSFVRTETERPTQTINHKVLGNSPNTNSQVPSTQSVGGFSSLNTGRTQVSTNVNARDRGASVQLVNSQQSASRGSRIHSSLSENNQVESPRSRTIDRGSSRVSSQPRGSNQEKPQREVTRNRGSKKFQPSAYLIQSSGLWQQSLLQSTQSRSSQSRSRSRSQGRNSLSNNQVQTAVDGTHTSGLPHSNIQNPDANVSFDNARIPSSRKSQEIASKPEASKQNTRFGTQTNNAHGQTEDISKQSEPTLSVVDIRKQTISTTATTDIPLTSAPPTPQSRGRAFGSRGSATFSSSNLLSGSQVSQSKQSSRSSQVNVETKSSQSFQNLNSQTNSNFNTQSSQVKAVPAFTTRPPLITQPPALNRGNTLKSTTSPGSFSTETALVNSDESTSSFGGRKVIKKKIIVNGRPGSRKSQEPSPSIKTSSRQVASNEEDLQKRQRALDALARFSPGFSNANLLSFKIVPNKPKESSKDNTNSAPLTTEAPFQKISLSSVATTVPSNQRQPSSRRRGNSRSQSSVTPPTTQVSQQRILSGSRSTTAAPPITTNRPVSQRRGHSSSRSTTIAPPVTTIAPVSQRGGFSRSRGTTRAPQVTTTGPVSQRRGLSRSRGTTTAPPITTTQTSQLSSRSSSRRLTRPVSVQTTEAPERATTASTSSTIAATTIAPFQRIRSKTRQTISTQKKNDKTPLPDNATSSPPLTQNKSRGGTRFRNPVSNSRRKVLKKVTPISDSAATEINHKDFTSSSAAESTGKQITSTTQNSAQSSGKPSGQLRVVGTSIETSVSSSLQSKKNSQLSSSSVSTPSSSTSSSRSRFTSRSRSSSFASRNTNRVVTKQQSVHEPLTDLELEALSALAQVNSAFGSAARHRSSTTSTSSSRRRNTSRSRSRVL